MRGKPTDARYRHARPHRRAVLRRLELRPVELQAVGRVTTNLAFFEFLILRETRGLASFLDTEVPEDALAISFRRRRQVWETL